MTNFNCKLFKRFHAPVLFIRIAYLLISKWRFTYHYGSLFEPFLKELLPF